MDDLKSFERRATTEDDEEEGGTTGNMWKGKSKEIHGVSAFK